MSFSGFKTHRLWYADADRKAKKEIVDYIRNWSLWLDLHILARTVRAVLFRQGAY
jgi:lipopolysaccharide/colanic/teichoic acid biosynthesis glycosyltransferase